MKLWPYPSILWNPGPIFIHIEIPILSFQTLELRPFFIHIRIFTSSFQTLEFWPYLFRDWNSYLIHLNIVSLSLLLYTLEFWPVSINLGILILSFPYNHCNSFLIFILSNFGIVFLSHPSYPSKHWNSGPIFMHLSFHWKYLNSGPVLINIEIFVLSF